ncbi:MAG: hypothetical protein ACKV0T_18015 [Planctomycetales bacterium]
MKVRGLDWGTALRLALPRPQRLHADTHVFLAVCDHYEPMWMRPPRAVQDARVERWVREYPLSVSAIEDSVGRAPQHTFFYPGDEYVPEHVEQIAELCRKGHGEVEIHLHHRNDTSQSLRDKLESYIETLVRRHGVLSKDARGRPAYAFIHGNWALDNSRPDGDWCGVNDELTILRETGCYADFTMPSAPDPCQTSTINSVYYAVDNPVRPKSHDRGVAARVGQTPPPNSLLMIQGPLGFDYHSRKWGLLPRLETGDLTQVRPATMTRFKLWRQARIGVAGRENWLFIKLHTHGAQEANLEMLLGGTMRRFHEALRDASRGGAFRYYYVTAREMADLVYQAESGQETPNVQRLGSQVAPGRLPDSEASRRS